MNMSLKKVFFALLSIKAAGQSVCEIPEDYGILTEPAIIHSFKKEILPELITKKKCSSVHNISTLFLFKTPRNKRYNVVCVYFDDLLNDDPFNERSISKYKVAVYSWKPIEGQQNKDILEINYNENEEDLVKRLITTSKMLSAREKHVYGSNLSLGDHPVLWISSVAYNKNGEISHTGKRVGVIYGPKTNSKADVLMGEVFKMAGQKW